MTINAGFDWSLCLSRHTSIMPIPPVSYWLHSLSYNLGLNPCTSFGNMCVIQGIWKSEIVTMRGRGGEEEQWARIGTETYAGPWEQREMKKQKLGRLRNIENCPCHGTALPPRLCWFYIYHNVAMNDRDVFFFDSELTVFPRVPELWTVTKKCSLATNAGCHWVCGTSF